MCDIIVKKKKISGGYEVLTSCKKSGKPITVSNKWGMFCEDMCDLDACKGAWKKIAELFSTFDMNRGSYDQ